MDPAAARIREAMQAVALQRQSRLANPELHAACLEIKRFQAQRFTATYADLLDSQRYQQAAHFFLNELYGDKDYAQRDQQFSRIANTIARLFPKAVLETAAALAEVHALTEALDDRMAQHWLLDAAGSTAARYLRCWRAVGEIAARQQQLQVVLHLGRELNRLTHRRGLRSLLKMMRGPAAAAGLSALQDFLEAGFDAFARMDGAAEFLKEVETRESALINSLFNNDAVACETFLLQLLARTSPH
jgi:hypothetical protein